MTEGAFALPAGACDCHTHVVGDPQAWPMLPDRHYTPGPAPVAALQQHLRGLGLQRTVIVQPSFYGTDNGCMLEALDALQGAGRGVAVLDDTVDDATLSSLHVRGVRGLRVNVESIGVRDPRAVEAAMQRWAGRIASLGWHLQVYAAPAVTAQLADFFERLPVHVVLDHFAMIPASLPLDDPSAQRLLALVRSGRAYVKLSAPYRVAPDWPATQVDALAQAFLAAHPQRVLWASDWPHTNREAGKGPLETSRYRAIAPANLRDTIARWLPTPALREQVLVANPARLYGF
jgi:predicted TIM-barrel fold metal-dependent hydrolase